MVVNFSEKVKQYCSSKQISDLVLVVDFMEEPCTQIYTPIVRPFKKKENIADFTQIGNFDGINLYYDSQFSEIFGISDELSFDLKGLLKKHIELLNMDPIIKNVCKLPGS